MCIIREVERVHVDLDIKGADLNEQVTDDLASSFAIPQLKGPFNCSCVCYPEERLFDFDVRKPIVLFSSSFSCLC
jgi:hypothetical protein